MGKSSTASCFKAIGCGDNESVDRDDLQAPQVKDSSDRRKWSFRKRSARHRVLSNSVVSETSSGYKASPDTSTLSFRTQTESPILEQSAEVQCIEEKIQVLKSETKLSGTVDVTDANSITINLDEPAVVIQTAIRRFLVERMLLKQNNIIKLQAVVRGHIVRKQAIGSLRCVQSIVKMQALVRGRQARMLLEESRTGGNEGKLQQIEEKENHTSTFQACVTYTSIEKLLENSFARQLLESKPSAKPINFKCDPLKSDSAWKWLERWMSASSTGNDYFLRRESTIEPKNDECLEKSEYQLDDVVPAEDNQLREGKLCTRESAASSEDDENDITYEMHSLESDAHQPSLESDAHQPSLGSHNVPIENSFDKAVYSLDDQTTESKFVSEVEPDSLTKQPEMDYEKHADALSQSQPESKTIEKKLFFGSRQASNSAFITAQSKFEEFSSAASLGKSVGLPDQDSGSKVSCEAVSLASNCKTMEIIPVESSPLPTSGIEVGGSECGTELSITSTLDSPDRLEVGLFNVEKETVTLEDANEHKENHINTVVDAQVQLPIAEKDLPSSNSVLKERDDNSVSTDSQHAEISEKDVVSSQVDMISKASETDIKIDVETDAGHQASKYSPDTSPRSPMTVPDSQHTPSSHVSTKPSKRSSGKSGPNHKSKSFSSGKDDHSDSYHDSGVRSSSEQLPKNHKTGKRRDSLGSSRTDDGDHEPRDSSSSNSLPSYMQATESARAKAVANSSPRSSPDVLDKGVYLNKRHSLPSSNTKQGSPRVQSSASPASQSAKSIGVQSPQERKWRR